MREHGSPEKGTNKVIKSGRKYPLACVQHKRVLALMPEGARLKFDRTRFVKPCPLPTRFLLRYGNSLSPRLLRYHVGLLRRSRAPHWRYAIFQQVARLGGPRFVKLASKIWNRMH
jgi:hypothetical protein